MSIILDIFSGDIRPEERLAPRIKELKNRLKQITKGEEEFLRKLKPEQKKEYEDVIDGKMEEISLTYEEAFAEGMKLGIRLMAEVFVETEE